MNNSSIRLILFGFLLTTACKSNQVKSDTIAKTKEELVLEVKSKEREVVMQDSVSETKGTPLHIVEPSKINPDDCNLTIKVNGVSGDIVEGTIVKISGRGFGFKDYINVGDSREFKLLTQLDGLKSGNLISGTIRTIGNSRDGTYVLRSAEIIK